MKTRARYGHLIKWIVSIVDLIMLNFSYGIVWFASSGMRENVRLACIIINLSYIIVLLCRNNIHDRRVLYADHVALHAMKSVLLHAGITLSLVSFLSLTLPFTGLLLFYATFTTLLVTWWLISRKVLKWYRNKGFNYRNVVVVGGGGAVARFVDEIKGDIGYGYHIVGVTGCDADRFPDLKHIEPENLEDFIKENNIDEIYCGIYDSDDHKLIRFINMAESHAIDFYYIPSLGSRITRTFSLLSFGNIPVMAVRPNPSLNPINKTIKRAFDIIVSLTVLIVSPIVFIPVAIAIKLSSAGPVFFKQKRTGYRGKEFDCYKFRTMNTSHETESQQATREDPRVTRVGRFLRHYSIDELPQFYNVLKGDMSIVGPRPHMVEHTSAYREIVEKYMVRHIVKPGITGWAQVRGYRGQTDELWMMEKRVECDVWYAENWNFMLDMKIILLTVINVFKGDKNAY